MTQKSKNAKKTKKKRGRKKKYVSVPTQPEVTTTITQLFKRIGEKPMIKSRKEEYALIEAAQKGDKDARNRLMEGNLRLVVKIAKYYMKTTVPLEDLFQEGTLGLARAIDKFDTSTGYKFSTYATWWVRQNITRYISTKSRTIRVPIKVSENIAKYNAALSKMEMDLGREPIPEEIAAYLDLPLRQVKTMLKANQIPSSLESTIRTEYGDDTYVKDLIPDTKSEMVDEQVIEDDRVIRLRKALNKLRPDERFVIANLSGIEKDPRIEGKVTKTKIATLLGFKGTAQVTNLQKRGMMKLRGLMREDDCYI